MHPKVLVGIGCSAGGLEVLRFLVSRLTQSSHNSVIVAQHMSPQSRSMLTDILARDTALDVVRAEDGIELEAGKIYVSTPVYDMTVVNKRLRLILPEQRIGPKPSIDALFCSIAKEWKENCVSIVLSGTGSDGAFGTKAIKAAGGLTVAQKPHTARYDGMPRSALATGDVDFTWSPDKISEELDRLEELMVHRTQEETPLQARGENPSEYEKVYEILRRKTKVDFSVYKMNTFERRLNRRLLATSSNLESYARYLASDDEEWRYLFHDILISVTSFFRDYQQFTTLTDRFSAYIDRHRSKESIRIWSAGCSSGEEPYSLAILALEGMRKLNLSNPPTLQIFATDIHEHTMQEARRGSFSKVSLEGLSDELIDRYFEQNDTNYQIKKDVRDLVLFARHDLTIDPPFMRMDLITCRNVFIYFDQDVQERILRMFHYALVPTGLLFLGKSESINAGKDLFQVLDSQAKIFERANIPADPSFVFGSFPTHDGQIPKYQVMRKKNEQDSITRDIIQSMAPHSLMLDEKFRVLAIFGKARGFLNFPEGEFTMELEQLLELPLRNKVMTVVHRCSRSMDITEISATIPDHDSREERVVTIRAFPLTVLDSKRVVLSFAEKVHVISSESSVEPIEIKELEQELTATREHLQTVIEEQETANEELQALNEELQSANEELQSTNEELETSNEELQSTNEELTTVNEELNTKSVQLADLFQYLTTIQDAIPNPIVVIDHEFHLKKFNYAAKATLNLNSTMVGSNFRLIETGINLSTIFETIEFSVKYQKAASISLKDVGRSFDVFSHPLMNTADEISGVVVTFLENTELTTALQRAHQVEGQLYSILNNIPALISVKNTIGHYTYVNPFFCQAMQRHANDIINKSDEEIFGASIGTRRRNRDFEVLKTKSTVLEDDVLIADDGTRRVYQTASLPLEISGEQLVSICSVAFDITHRDFTERQIRNFQRFARYSNDLFLAFDCQDQHSQLVFGDELVAQLFGYEQETFRNASIFTVLSSIANLQSQQDLEQLARDLSSHDTYEFTFEFQTKKDQIRFFKAKSAKVNESDHTQLLITIVDITEERENSRLVQQQQEDLLRASRLASLGEMAAGIAHELKTPLNTIQGYVDLVHEYSRHRDVDETISDAMSNIEDTVSRISEIIVGLKSISRNREGEKSKTCNLKSIVAEVAKICEYHLKNKGVEFRNLIEADLKVTCQPTQISQVLINLINNSVDAISLLQERWVEIGLKQQDSTILLQVTDSGTGIPDSIASQILTPFFTTKKDGTGLGLSLSRNILKAHQGDLYVDKTCSNTRFVVSLPIHTE
ncbi:CheR family methyltransferase [Pseudobacteriovorax antillogorgiicola]|uniref:histidine kinase n=1 Tax=Pseudobacteriovorax antillogorgiicola TaxID=1513793 RepID=A0A1Y6BA28_9BACT|nr:CheR family methyltransferase [Pseudobacteriovorax antillogorgiicola]TCS57463.1 two-component system CheB/CheR fusion protein [Pseudobacteriovorax antillogorgiicola]SMF00746.1 two-component system, chemotaxis family, CheB/CheR fusion protein [Pseudobacteriovorax antillogorgiicola]